MNGLKMSGDLLILSDHRCQKNVFLNMFFQVPFERFQTMDLNNCIK